LCGAEGGGEGRGCARLAAGVRERFWGGLSGLWFCSWLGRGFGAGGVCGQGVNGGGRRGG
jgi:hypothetical protein